MTMSKPRSSEDIMAMLRRFDAAVGDDPDRIPEDMRAAWDVLAWCAEDDTPNEYVTDYLPKEPSDGA
jgi:hypothetical protein